MNKDHINIPIEDQSHTSNNFIPFGTSIPNNIGFINTSTHETYPRFAETVPIIPKIDADISKFKSSSKSKQILPISKFTFPKTQNSQLTFPETQKSQLTFPKTQKSQLTFPETQNSQLTFPETPKSQPTFPKTQNSQPAFPKTQNSQIVNSDDFHNHINFNNNEKNVKEVIGVITKIITLDDIKKYSYLSFLRGHLKSDNLSVIEEEIGNIGDDADNGPKLKCKNSFFQLETKNNGKIICYSGVHFPVQKHDAVFGEVKEVFVPVKYDQQNGEMINEPGTFFEFTHVPIGLVGTTKHSFYDNLIRYSYGRIKGNIATGIYNQLTYKSFQKSLEEYSSLNSTSTSASNLNLNSNSTSTSSSNSTSASAEASNSNLNSTSTVNEDDINMAFQQLSMLSENYRKSPSYELNDMFEKVNGTTCKHLFSNWYWYFLRRRIELLGVERPIITKMTNLGYTMTDLYSMIRNDAFTILPMPINEAIILKKRLGQNYTDFDLSVANIARTIYNKVMEDKWTSIPLSYIGNSLSSKYIDSLTTKYKMIYDLESIYFAQHYNDEVLVAERLIKAKISVSPYDTENIIYVNGRVNTLTNEQKLAIKNSLENPLSIVCGKGGTGKTTIIEQICANLDNQDKRYEIVAFTGRAVARIKQENKYSSTPMTIHSLCNGGYNDTIMDDNKYDDRPFDHLIIDETSMAHLSLMAMIYRTFKHDFGVTFVGDIDQLQPIGWGFLYKELLKTDVCSKNRLTKNLRVRNSTFDSGIIENVSRLTNIIEGDRQIMENANLFDVDLVVNNYSNNTLPISLTTYYNMSNGTQNSATSSYNNMNHQHEAPIQNNSRIQQIATYNRNNFEFVIRPDFTMLDGDYDTVRITLKNLVYSGVKPCDIIILSPYNRCLNDLNTIAQDVCIIDRSDYINCEGKTFYTHDVVMMTKNDYTVNIMNGTTGTINFFEYKSYNISNRRLSKYQQCQLNTGYVQIDFTTGETARFFIEYSDHIMYQWCLKIIPYLTIITKDIKHFEPNSGEEWDAIIDCINKSRTYYQTYSSSPSRFAASPTFSRTDVQMIFEPLTRISRHYGYMGYITHGYAVTVHKAQGSQWLHTIPYIDNKTNGGNFLNNTLLNTMLTRAECTVHCIGNITNFISAALRPAPLRYDRLAIRLKQLYDKHNK